MNDLLDPGLDPGLERLLGTRRRVRRRLALLRSGGDGEGRAPGTAGQIAFLDEVLRQVEGQIGRRVPSHVAARMYAGMAK